MNYREDRTFILTRLTFPNLTAMRQGTPHTADLYHFMSHTHISLWLAYIVTLNVFETVLYSRRHSLRGRRH